jgi:membrane protease YdiL (CAAX protease family)
MSSITGYINRHPQTSFWIIACGTFYLAFLGYMMVPSDAWQLAIYFTFIGAIIVTAIADGRTGLRTFFSRIVRWRVNVVWYAVALFLPLLINLTAVGINLALGGQISSPFQLSLLPALIPQFIYAFFVIAPGEEPGFRGFALPRLLIGRTALSASLILGVLHVLWHLPLFVFGLDSPMTILIVMAGAIINTWLFNKTNGSVLLNMLLHASVDTCFEIFNPMFTEAAAVRQGVILMLVFVAVGVLLWLVSGSELGRRRGATMEADAMDQPAMS